MVPLHERTKEGGEQTARTTNILLTAVTARKHVPIYWQQKSRGNELSHFGFEPMRPSHSVHYAQVKSGRGTTWVMRMMGRRSRATGKEGGITFKASLPLSVAQKIPK